MKHLFTKFSKVKYGETIMKDYTDTILYWKG